ncbi:hypothetical protein WICPIJ_001973 [Wickerhamomyces pijperi]|uniref:Uncharacterized protein n=1 Tax=Wickerhamomyces pijperi TaxID=599730 RepID=A0A9P8QCN5_WICPI|nr:hypothetical protein WICPIJ_001973 [Wickerhamomyces pijperi]
MVLSSKCREQATTDKTFRGVTVDGSNVFNRSPLFVVFTVLLAPLELDRVVMVFDEDEGTRSPLIDGNPVEGERSSESDELPGPVATVPVCGMSSGPEFMAVDPS